MELSLYPVTFHRQRLGLGFLMDSVRVPHLANLDLDEPLLLHHLPSESDMSYVLLDHPQLGPVFHPRPGKALKEFLSRHWTEGKPVPMLSLVHPEDRSLVKKQVGLKLRRESGCFQIYSFRLLGGDDLYHEMEVHSYPVQCEGKPAIHGFLRDVAREKREARDLSLHFGQLNHRLRNILTPLRSRLVAISMETGFPKRRKGLMDDCIRTVEEAGAVVSEGLSNTQVSSFELDALTPAAEVIRRIVEDLRRRPPRADIELTLSSGDARIRYHYARFLDLFVNLYDNSCREMQALNRTPRIKLVVSRVAEGRAIRCEWTDEGPGIPEDRKETIFQPFKSFSQRGVGLGLWTARRVAEGHGGSIIENGVPGQGARFILEIPVAREMAQQESSYTSEGSKP
ncbi:MAG: HAMP domain-containing histidine kinase [Deltaproteobacteria bacterium]|nr:HAMP domain-containing histidine kinase [Deltaproteobacteria bacterium]